MINNLDHEIFGEKGASKHQITLDDIAKCKGSGSFAAQIIGQIQTRLLKGEFVTDKTIAKFMEEHLNHLDVISKKFVESTVVEEGPHKPHAAQIKNDQKIARRLAPVFDRAAESLKLNDKTEKVTAFQAKMKTSHCILKGLEALESLDPEDLLRAKIYEGRVQKDDLKNHFIQFVHEKNISIATKDDLYKAYHQYTENAIARGVSSRLQAYPQDQSLFEYQQAENDLLHSEQEIIAKIHKMDSAALIESVFPASAKTLSTINGSDDVPNYLIKLKLIDRLRFIQLNADKHALLNLFKDPNIAPVLKEMAKQGNMREGFEFIAAVLDAKNSPLDDHQAKINRLIDEFVEDTPEDAAVMFGGDGPVKINIPAAVQVKLLFKHDKMDDLNLALDHIVNQFIDNILSHEERYAQIINRWTKPLFPH